MPENEEFVEAYGSSGVKHLVPAHWFDDGVAELTGLRRTPSSRAVAAAPPPADASVPDSPDQTTNAAGPSGADQKEN